MAEVFTLKPEDEERIHPHALKRLNDWRSDIGGAVPQLEQATLDEINVDVNTYLDDDEKGNFKKNVTEVGEWVRACMDIGAGYSDRPFSTDVIGPMLRIKSMLTKVYERKIQRAREEQRRQVAFKALNPPFQDARIYLDSEEYKEFEESIVVAVDACLAKGESYISDSRAEAYFWWCTTIKNREEEKERKRVAERKSWEYNLALGEEAKRLRSMLHPEKQNPEDYFEKGVVDLRYTGESFEHFLSAEGKQSFDTAVNAIIREKLGELISHIYHQFIDWECLAYYFLLPWSDYVFEGVPCLDFSFNVFAVAETKVWLKPGKIGFDDYMFSLPQIEHKCDSYASYFTELEKPEFLGYHYVVLTPAEFGGYVFWQTIPLVLVAGLINGDTEPAGATISGVSETETTYTIKGFEEEVTIPNGFASYLKEIGGIDQMVSIGILSEKAANVIEKRLTQLEAGEKGGSLQNSQATGFKNEELISSLTSLGVPRRTAEELCSNIPKNLALQEATKLAMQNYNEIIAHRHSAKS
jgi:hypothetical protein